jgi:hypothetical protein
LLTPVNDLLTLKSLKLNNVTDVNDVNPFYTSYRLHGCCLYLPLDLDLNSTENSEEPNIFSNIKATKNNIIVIESAPTFH